MRRLAFINGFVWDDRLAEILRRNLSQSLDAVTDGVNLSLRESVFGFVELRAFASGLEVPVVEVAVNADMNVGSTARISVSS